MTKISDKFINIMKMFDNQNLTKIEILEKDRNFGQQA